MYFSETIAVMETTSDIELATLRYVTGKLLKMSFFNLIEM